MELRTIIISVITAVVLLWFAVIGYTIYVVNDNGGIKNTIIEIGKDVKEIGQEIGKD